MLGQEPLALEYLTKGESLSALLWLECEGLIRKDERRDGVYTTTGRGHAHVVTLCKTPWPVKKWVDHSGAIIETEAP